MQPRGGAIDDLGLLARPRPKDRTVASGGTARATGDAYTGQLYDAQSDWDVIDAVERVARGLGIKRYRMGWYRYDLKRPMWEQILLVKWCKEFLKMILAIRV